MHGLFVTFEGIDGSGKTTVANLVADYLRQHQQPSVVNAALNQRISLHCRISLRSTVVA